MHGRLGMRGLLAVVGAALVLALALPATAEAKPKPGAKRSGFRLFAQSLNALRVNRVDCGLNSDKGHICVDVFQSSTGGGGFWPRGSAQQYVFNSGLQLAGIIGANGGPWAGDTAGAFLFDPKGTTEHGAEVRPIVSTQDPSDNAQMDIGGPFEYARVPDEVNEADEVFNPVLRGQKNAGQGDMHFITWEGDPANASGRPHPLGIVVETRGFGWNYPTFNNDILYFTYTFYNVTSLNAADYANVRPTMQPILMEMAQEFHAKNNATLPAGQQLPTGGYTIDPFYAAFAADMDVTINATDDFSTVALPLGLGNTYHYQFEPIDPGPYDPGIFGDPFFVGAGIVGVKYLRGPDGTSNIQLFSNTTNGGQFTDADDTFQLYRYLSGNIQTPPDDPCNTGNPAVTHICYINPTEFDQRFFQSSSALTLPPGGFGTIVVAYIFAAPVAVASYTPGNVVLPGDPLLITNAATINTTGVNMIDSISGFLGWTDRTPGNPGACNFTGADSLAAIGVVDQCEIQTVPGSLYGKALVAQAIFNSRFLLPAAPDAPDFYLLPEDGKVTVLWQASRTETNGDPYFALASDPTSLQYDPNYRFNDVEGYRVYRGRADNPASLTLLASFDYSGTVMSDYTGQVNPDPECAPDLTGGRTSNCPVVFDYYTRAVGAPATTFHDVPLTGDVFQVRLGTRLLTLNPLTNDTLAVPNFGNPEAFDTAVTGRVSGGFPALIDNGVPFSFVDVNVQNNFRYFYSVTAFDLNSFQSGPSSIESNRVTKSATPRVNSSNTDIATLDVQIVDPTGQEYASGGTFTVDPGNGTFNGPPLPTGPAGVTGVVDPFVPALLPDVQGPDGLIATMDSVRGRASAEPYPDDNITAFDCRGLDNPVGLCWEVFVTYNFVGQGSVQTSSVVNQPILTVFGDPESVVNPLTAGGFAFDPDRLAANGFPAGLTFTTGGTVRTAQHGYYSAGENFNGRRVFGNVNAGGSRWFSGANEALADPTVGIRVGNLPGVDTIFAPLPHIDANPAVAGIQPLTNSLCMQVYLYGLSPFGRNADIQVTWGAGGAIASVRDVTDRLDVPFKPIPQSSWGFVPDGNGNGIIDWQDIRYTEGVLQVENHIGFCDGSGAPFPTAAPGAGTVLSQAATVGPVSSAALNDPGAYVATGQGFGLYVSGHYHIFQLTGGALPAAGTVWTLRGYSGAVRATTAEASADPSDYTFTARPGNPYLPGLRIRYGLIGTTGNRAVTKADLDRVHTVPDPYYVTNQFEVSTDEKILKFVNLPNQAIIRIYTVSGILVDIIEHNSTTFGGTEDWNLRNRNNQVIASGVYFYHIESGDARKVGRFTVVNFAQ